MAQLQHILSSLNLKANNLEEICCGIHHRLAFYKEKENREQLINDIQNELDELQYELNELKALG